MPIHWVLPLGQALCCVLSTGVTSRSLQSNEERETIILRYNYNKSKVQNAKSAWQAWETPDRSSLKSVISVEIGK